MAVLLVGTDFSPRSDRALRRATLLARQSGYELLIVAVLEDSRSTETPDTQRRKASKLLHQLQRTIAGDDGIPCEVELRTGKPSEQLAEAARQSGAAMMVIGPHGRMPIRDMFGAVTAERIVRNSPVPLIAANGVPAGPYRRLLLPVDLEDASRQTARALRTLGFTDETDIRLLHVYDAEAREMLGRAMVSTDERNDYLAERAAAAKEDLRTFAASAELEHAALLVEESKGPVSADVERVAEEVGSDLVVLTRSATGAIGRSIAGSVTEDFLRSGRLDVLVFPVLQ